MRITYTSLLHRWDPRHGGGQRIVHDLACAMVERGHQVRVVYSTGSTRPPSALPYDVATVSHHERLYLNPVEFGRAFWRYGPGADVIHTHGYEGALLRRAIGGGIPLVATSHHPDPLILTDRPASWRPLANLKWGRDRVVAFWERRALRSAELVVCTSRHSANVLVQRGYLSASAPVAVVHNGAARAVANSPSPGNLEFVCVARLDTHKGIDVLLRAAAILGRPFPRIDLLGAGREEASLRSLVAELGLGESVRFRGHADEGEVAAFLANAMALVLPSRAENFPLVILEALHWGLPIVATAVGGIPEAIRHEKEALLVPPDEPSALAGALKRLRDDAQLRRRLSSAAQARATTFTWERSAAQLEGLYRSVLDGNASRGR